MLDRFGARPTLVLYFGGCVAGLWLLLFVNGFVPLVAVTVLISSWNGCGVVTQTYIADSLPDDMQGTGLGTLKAGWMVVGATSPLLIGTLADYGSFDYGFLLLASVGTVGLVLSITRLCGLPVVRPHLDRNREPFWLPLSRPSIERVLANRMRIGRFRHRPRHEPVLFSLKNIRTSVVGSGGMSDHPTIGDTLEQTVDRYPDRDAIIYPRKDQHWTYAEFNERVNRLANALLEAGIETGDRVATVLYNGSEMAVTVYACAKIGAVFTPLNFRLPAGEIEYIVNDAEAKMVLFESETREAVEGRDRASSPSRSTCSPTTTARTRTVGVRAWVL